MIEYIKNPIVISIIVSALILIGCYFYKKEEFKKDIKKSGLKYGIVSMIVGIISWFFLSTYMETPQLSIEIIPATEVANIRSDYRVLDTKGGIKSPPPDIFLEVAQF